MLELWTEMEMLSQKIEMLLQEYFYAHTNTKQQETMTRFHQTVAPIGLMMGIWFKLSIGFGMLTFFEMLIQAPEVEKTGYQGWANMTEMYKNWTDTAVCQSGAMSQFVNEYPDLSGVLLMGLSLFTLGSLRAGVHIIMPYYLTTAIIGLWTL